MLVLVVGPSGAGKDTLLREARKVYGEDPGYLFAQREIDRPPDQNEQNLEIDRPTWERRVAQGAYALSWEANGRVYGVRRAIEDDLRAGRVVVVNYSRERLGEARLKYAPLRIVHVTASAEVLIARRETRGRETAQEARDRAARDAAFVVRGEDVVEIRNDGPFEDSVAAFVSNLSRHALGHAVE